MMDEVGGIVKVLTAHPRSHIVFTSTKCVYGIAHEEERIEVLDKHFTE